MTGLSGSTGVGRDIYLMRRFKFAVLIIFGLFGFTFFAYERSSLAVEGKASGNTLNAPTGVNASDGNFANKVGILWNAVPYATTYRIFRNTTNNPGSATDVGTTPANYFYDTTAVTNQIYFYWVRAENTQGNSDVSAPDQGLRAIGTIGPGPFPPLDPPTAPTGNPVTAAKAALGKTLFWDEQMSSTKTVSCGTCHRPAEGGSDPRTAINLPRSTNPGFDNTFGTMDDVFGSPGVPKNNVDGTYSVATHFGFNEQVTGRKSPSYLNGGYTRGGLFWDGRADDVFRDPITNAVILNAWGGLESQALGPPVSGAEMAHGGRDWTQVAARVSASKPLALASNSPLSLQSWIDGRNYPQLFEEAFGTPDVTPARIAMAIATHERSLFSDHTPLDKWAAQIQPLTAQEETGRTLFVNLQCNTCHDGALLTDNNFHNIGVRPQNEDVGRGGVTMNTDDNGRFKTPTLRNVELHAPYMHNGRFATLEDVVEFYDRGGDHDAPNIDRGVIRPLNLTMQEKADLAAFMRRPLTDTRVQNELPPFDRPQLYTESTRVPQISGTGRTGSGAIVPNAIAIEPPLVGNPSFTVAVSQGLGGAQGAVVVIDSSDPGVGSSIPGSGSFTRSTVNLTGAGAGNGYGSVSLAIPNNPALVGQTFYGRWYVPDAGATNGFSVSRLFSFTIFGVAAPKAAHVDFDGDRKTDISIFRPGPGEWWYLRSSDSQNRALQFGAGTDKIVPADYTGDGKTDVANWRPSNGAWLILRSEDFTFYSYPFGANGDMPAPGDYDGDGKADTAVFRPSSATWFILQSSNGAVRFEGFGVNGDIPQVGDYDADGKSDIAIFRPNGVAGSEWWISRSTAGVLALQFGLPTDKPVASDFTGDGKTDVAFWRPSDGFWFVLRSENFSFYAVPFGSTGDIPAPGDYDGDGRTDTAVFRPSAATWYANRSTQGIMIVGFGVNGDYPVPAAYVP
ncbi:MAG: cytochrome c peroxidase [Blastocatellia bacterium]